MTRLELFDESLKVSVTDLAPGDVIFIPFTGKRVVADVVQSSVFLDYPRRPRVRGSALAVQPEVEPDPDMSLGWVHLDGPIDCVGRRDLGATAGVGQARAEADLALPHTIESWLGEASAVLEEATLVRDRRGGRPVDEHLRELSRRTNALGREYRSLPDSEAKDDCEVILDGLERFLGGLRVDTVTFDSAALRRRIGLVLTADDDL
jgi:hypothetical protein